MPTLLFGTFPSNGQQQRWERTKLTNLLRYRQSGTYYARLKVNGKQKWRGLETEPPKLVRLAFDVAAKHFRSTLGVQARTRPSATPDAVGASLVHTIDTADSEKVRCLFTDPVYVDYSSLVKVTAAHQPAGR